MTNPSKTKVHPRNNEHVTPTERIAALRKRLGMTQRDLAKEFGVTAGAIAHWESGTRSIPGPVMKLIEIYETAYHSRKKIE